MSTPPDEAPPPQGPRPAPAADQAIEGLLAELGRAGLGADERFVGGVLARVSAEGAVPSAPASPALEARGLSSGGAGSPRRVRRWAVSAFATAAVVAICWVALRPARPAHAVLIDTQREVIVLRDGQRLPARPGMALRPADELVADGFFSAATFRYGDQPTVVRLLQNGRLRLERGGDAAKHLVLSAGKIECEVSRQRHPRPLTIATPHVLATVLGTGFSLTAGEHHSRLDVERGQVQLQPRRSANSQERLLRSGEFAEVTGSEVRAGTPTPTVVALHLIDADTGRPFADHTPLRDGQQIARSAVGARRMTVVADVAGPVGSVVFRMDGQGPAGKERPQIEDNPPFTLTGNAPVAPNRPIQYHDWRPAPGEHVIEAIPYAADRGVGVAGPPLRLRVVVLP